MSATIATTSRTKLPENNLDVLRAIAVLLVLVDHTIESLGNHALPILWLGQAGVQAFFVHTSLVLMSSLERDGAPDASGWIKRFYVRRAFRIYPLVWAVVALTLLLGIPRGLIPAVYEAPTLATIVANVALVQDIAGVPNILAVMWSLPIEVQMYVVLPAFYLIARARSSWPMVLTIFASLAIMAVFLYGTEPQHAIPGLWRVPMLQYAPSFSMGVLAYHLLRRRANNEKLPAQLWLPTIVAAIVASTLVVTTPGAFWIPRLVVCGVLAIGIPLLRDTASNALTRVAHTIAVYSYGIYLLHMPALRMGFSYFSAKPMAVQWAVFAATLLGGCYAAYHLVEKPGIALGRWVLRDRARPVSLEATAPVP